ncbi:8208_t:CDS:2 [Funneliformis caledonium]|uniref:8208_t:CDS:1 n=1 Tax=Funneliformis caledonium TaxID=1117310 RepID=A0A9N9ERH5_9GLOM|nr:8208_t:CDS:2 [Funneliformis caledonium]
MVMIGNVKEALNYLTRANSQAKNVNVVETGTTSGSSIREQAVAFCQRYRNPRQYKDVYVNKFLSHMHLENNTSPQSKSNMIKVELNSVCSTPTDVSEEL